MSFTPISSTNDLFDFSWRSPSPFNLGEEGQKIQHESSPSSLSSSSSSPRVPSPPSYTPPIDIHLIKLLISKCKTPKDVESAAKESGIPMGHLQVFYKLLNAPFKQVAVPTFTTSHLAEWNHLRTLIERGEGTVFEMMRFEELERLRLSIEKALLKQMKT